MDALTITAAALIVAGLLVDVLCKLTGTPTVSKDIHRLERIRPWTRWIVGLSTFLLFTHLTFAIPA